MDELNEIFIKFFTTKSRLLIDAWEYCYIFLKKKLKFLKTITFFILNSKKIERKTKITFSCFDIYFYKYRHFFIIQASIHTLTRILINFQKPYVNS